MDRSVDAGDPREEAGPPFGGSSGSIVFTTTLLEYALAARHAISQVRPADMAVPLLWAAGEPFECSALADYYRIGVSTRQRGALEPGAPDGIADLLGLDHPDRAACNEWGSHEPPPEQLATAIMRGRDEPGPVWIASDGSTNGASDVVRVGFSELTGRLAASHGDRGIVVAPRASGCCVPAALYAAACNRLLVLSDDVVRHSVACFDVFSGSVLMVTEPDSLTKRTVADVARRTASRDPQAAGVGILTGGSVTQLAALVWRSLVHRAFVASGQRSAFPAGAPAIAAADMEPLEYYILAEHGNEAEIEHGEVEILAAREATTEHEPKHPDDGDALRRVPARHLPVHNLILLSCDMFTPSDGMAPRSRSLLYELLSGWPTAIIAPYKHAQVSAGQRLLVESLIESGYSLGEITHRLNGIAAHGSRPDPAYVLLGDPETLVRHEGRNCPLPAPHVRRERGSVTVSVAPRGSRALEWWAESDDLAAIGSGGTPLALDPLSNALFDRRVLFTLIPRPESLGVLVFRTDEFPNRPLDFRIRAADGMPRADRDELALRAKRLAGLHDLGVDLALADASRSTVLSAVRTAAAYPRLIEFVMGERAARNVTLLLSEKLRRIRHDVLHALLDGIRVERSWLAHRYRSSYPDVKSTERDEAYADCSACGNATTHWTYADPAGELEPRRLVICDRCGIIADLPKDHPVEVRLDAPDRAYLPSFTGRLTVRNRSTECLDVALAAQFNEWERTGVTADPAMHEVALDPGAEADLTVDFGFERSLGPESVSVHVYAMSERCELSVFTRKIIVSEDESTAAANPAVSGSTEVQLNRVRCP